MNSKNTGKYFPFSSGVFPATFVKSLLGGFVFGGGNIFPEQPLTFDLPARKQPSSKDLSIHPKHINRWIEDLPRASLRDTVQQVYRLVKNSNQLFYSYKERVRFLESIESVVHYAAEALSQHLLSSSYSLRGKQKKLASAICKLFMAMSTGYKVALEDSLASGAGMKKKQWIAFLVHRAMSYSSRTLLVSYKGYVNSLPGVWDDLHKMYCYAESCGFDNSVIKDTYNKMRINSSVKEVYLRALLLSLSSPYKMRRGTVEGVYHALEELVDYCDIKRGAKWDQPLGQDQFVVVLQGDAPPGSLKGNLAEEGHPESHWVLDTGGLAERLHNELERKRDLSISDGSGGISSLSHHLLCHLLEAWCDTPRRGSFPRTEKSDVVQVLIGLSSIHRHLVHYPVAYPVLADNDVSRQRERRAGIRRRWSGKDADIWKEIYDAFSAQPQPVTEEVILMGDVASQAVDHGSYYRGNGPASSNPGDSEWLLVNESASGYCVERIGDSEILVDVGDLIALQRRKDGVWGVGVVCWMKLLENHKVQLGVELLAPEVMPVSLYPVSGSEKQTTYQRALLLPELPQIGCSATLVTAAKLPHMGDRLICRVMDKEFPVVTGQEMKNNGIFIRHGFDFQDGSLSAAPEAEDGLDAVAEVFEQTY